MIKWKCEITILAENIDDLYCKIKEIRERIYLERCEYTSVGPYQGLYFVYNDIDGNEKILFELLRKSKGKVKVIEYRREAWKGLEEILGEDGDGRETRNEVKMGVMVNGRDFSTEDISKLEEDIRGLKSQLDEKQATLEAIKVNMCGGAVGKFG